ncbi:unnamed protein product [Mesocestoides corti]|nr:unnamed protein product [Mesocestoides corti]
MSLKFGNVPPSECRLHYESVYIWGRMSSVCSSKSSVTGINMGDQYEECLCNLCVDQARVPIEACRQLGLMPKRDDYECEYDNNAEESIVDIRSDFLEDELFRELAVARIDAFVECLRQRQLRHVVVAKLNLLTHLLPKLLPTPIAKVSAVSHGSIPACTALGRCRYNHGTDIAFRRRANLFGQRRSGQRTFRSTRTGCVTETTSSLGSSPFEDVVKHPPPSVESVHDSGIASSDSSVHSATSPETETVVVPSPEIGTIANDSDGRHVPPSKTPVEVKCLSLTPLPSVVKPNDTLILQSQSMLRGGPKNRQILGIPTDEAHPNCCTPLFVAEPLKPLLRFLSCSEANALLRQLHKEHVLRQEIEQLEQLQKSHGILRDNIHLAGARRSASPINHTSDDFSVEDDVHPLSPITALVASPKRRRTVAPTLPRRKRRGRSPVSSVMRGRGGKRNGGEVKPSSSVVGGVKKFTAGCTVSKRRGRPPLHHHGERQQQLIHT